MHVEDHGVGAVRCRHAKGFAARRRHGHRIPEVGEVLLEHLADVRFVVDDEDHGRLHVRCSITQTACPTGAEGKRAGLWGVGGPAARRRLISHRLLRDVLVRNWPLGPYPLNRLESSACDTGLIKWASKPASLDRCRSSAWPYPVTAISVIVLPAGLARSARATS